MVIEFNQFLLLLLGLLSIYFLSSEDIKYLKYGFIFGLCAEPFWLYSSITTGQWSITILVCVYTVCHIRGLINCYKREKFNENTQKS